MADADAARTVKLQGALDATLAGLETTLDPFFALKLKDVIPRLAPLENARLNVTISYAVTSLMYMYLRTQGEDAKSHPLWKELARVKTYMQKVNKTAKELEGGCRARCVCACVCVCVGRRRERCARRCEGKGWGTGKREEGRVEVPAHSDEPPAIDPRPHGRAGQYDGGHSRERARPCRPFRASLDCSRVGWRTGTVHSGRAPVTGQPRTRGLGCV